MPTHELFDTVLVANRGEIACRIIDTLHRMGITSAAIYSTADAGAPHVQMADRAFCVGPAAAAESYLNIEAVIDAAQRLSAQAIHPGYGFLAESVDFARACRRAGLTFIGPGEQALEVMGDKIQSKNYVGQAGVPLIDGVSTPDLTDDELTEAGKTMRFPILIKPSAGGGGKGMHIVESADQLPDAIRAARRVAQAAFGDDALFIEQLIRSPRHIEVQVLADTYGQVIHLGERECSLQRRHQKVIEESPSPLLDPQTRQRIGQAACDTARSVDYCGAGTVEFLVSDADPETFYFMEMNTRLQVEHPVTEETTGIDLVEQQIRIAAGEQLNLSQQDIQLTGHAVEARLYAEDPASGFMPSTGRVLALSEPDGRGIRVDSGLAVGLHIGTDYDPMLAKIITTGTTRDQAMRRLHRALGQTRVLGLRTNSSFLRQLVADPDIRAGAMDTTMIERKLPQMSFPGPSEEEAWAAASYLAQQRGLQLGAEDTAEEHTGPAAEHTGPADSWQLDGWRATGHMLPEYQVLYQNAEGDVELIKMPLDNGLSEATSRGSRSLYSPLLHDSRTNDAQPDGAPTYDSPQVTMAIGEESAEGVTVWLASEHFTGAVTVRDRQAQVQAELAEIEAELTDAAPEVTAPMPGTVVAVDVTSAQNVTAGEPLLTLEAMKMEHRLTAPMDGVVRLHASPGDHVPRGHVLATVEPSEATTTPQQ